MNSVNYTKRGEIIIEIIPVHTPSYTHNTHTHSQTGS